MGRVRIYTPEQKEAQKKSRREYYHKTGGRERYWEKNLKNKYGISVEDYEAVLKAQDGGCAICGSKTSRASHQTRLHVDHDHKTNVVRGLLCAACNCGISKFYDTPSLLIAAVAYLESSIPSRMMSDWLKQYGVDMNREVVAQFTGLVAEAKEWII